MSLEVIVNKRNRILRYARKHFAYSGIQRLAFLKKKLRKLNYSSSRIKTLWINFT